MAWKKTGTVSKLKHYVKDFEIGTEAFETLKGVQHSSFTSLLAYWRQQLRKMLDTQKLAIPSVLRIKRKYCDLRGFRLCFKYCKIFEISMML